MEEEKSTAYLALLEAYREELENVDKQIIYIQALVNDYTRAKMTVEKLSEVDKETEILVPIGGGVFIPMKVKKGVKALVSEGADVFIESSLDYAGEAIQRKIDELNEGLTRLNDIANQIRQKMEEISEKLQEEKKDV